MIPLTPQTRQTPAGPCFSQALLSLLSPPTRIPAPITRGLLGQDGSLLQGPASGLLQHAVSTDLFLFSEWKAGCLKHFTLIISSQFPIAPLPESILCCCITDWEIYKGKEFISHHPGSWEVIVCEGFLAASSWGGGNLAPVHLLILFH